MSIVAMNWAWDVRLDYLGERDNKAGRRLLLVALGDNANEQGICWPAISTLARRCESSTKSVRRWLHELEEYQLLAIQPRRNDAGQTSNLYALRLDRSAAEKKVSPPDTESRGEGDTESTPLGHGDQGPRTPDDQGPRTPGVPLTTNEPPVNPSHSDARAASSTPDWFGESLTDDGQPLDDPADPSPPQADHRQRQQPMTLDWEPEPETWRRACWERGLAPDADVHQPLLDFREHFAALPGRTATHSDWTRRFARWVHENLRRLAPATGGHRDASRHAGSAQPADHADQRRRVREQLANPEDLSWASGLWDDPAAWAEPGAPGGDEAAGGPGVHPADGAVPEDLGERVSERPGAESGTPRAGAGAGPLAGATDPCGDRAGDERAEASGEYLAADDPGADGDASAHPGGFRYATAR